MADHADFAGITENGTESVSTSPSASWDTMYATAKQFHQKYGSLNAPDHFVCENGIHLGEWLTEQRRSRAGLTDNSLTEEQIAALDALGMIWHVPDFVFERNFRSASAYYRDHGDLECKSNYVDNDGVKLGAWLAYLREQYKKRGRFMLTEEQFRMLDTIGMRWESKHDVQWNEFFNCLIAYQEHTGNTDVAVTYKEGDVPLGRWYYRQKELYTSGKLREDRAVRFLARGCNLKIEDAWEWHYQLIKNHIAGTGDAEIPPDLKKWLKYQISCLRKGTLSEDRAQKLSDIGITAEVPEKETQHSRSVALFASEAPQTGNAVNG